MYKINKDLPPFNEREKRSFIEEKILDFSSNLFRNKIFGVGISLVLNIVCFYSYFKKKSSFSILCSLFLLYLILKIILFNVFKIQDAK